MSTAVEAVWSRLKEAAGNYAREGRRPTFREAQRQISRWMAEERVSPKPPPEVIAFYAIELLRMVEGTEQSA